jgi:hypothetical protein
MAAVLLISCGIPLIELQSTKNPTKGMVTVLITDGNTGARTLIPTDITFSRYTVSFTQEGKEPVELSSADEITTAELESGPWEITVKGYVTRQGKDYLAAQGSAPVTVTAGQAINAPVTITANQAGEEGIFSYDIRLALDVESLDKALLTLESLDVGSGYKEKINLKDDGAERGSFPVKPGFYLLKVQLENAWQAAGKTEVVHIYTNMETKAEYTFKSSDFTKTVPLGGTAELITHGEDQEKATLFIYSDEKCDDLITSTEVDLATKKWNTVIPASYTKVYYKLGIDDVTGFFFSKDIGSTDIPEIGKIDIALSATVPEPKLTTFSISASETGLAIDLVGSINQSTSAISLETLGWIDYEKLDVLKATFETVGVVTVNDMRQESGNSPNSFRQSLVYRVTTEDNAKRDYTVVFECPQTTGLPVIKIDTKDSAKITSKETYIKTNIAVHDPDRMDYSFENTGYKDEIRGRGNSTWSWPKKPYRLKFDKKTSLFGAEKAKSWVLLANYIDPTLIMNTVTFELGRRMGLPYTNHATPVELFLNGVYQGSYVLTEQMQVGKGRVDIDEDAGFFVELDSYYDEDPKFRTDLYNLPVMIKSPEDLTDSSGYDFVKTAINALETAMAASAFPESGYRDLIDMYTFVDFLLINEMVGNVELGHPKSTYMYKDAGEGKISMGPLWDFDWAFGYSGSGHNYFNTPLSRNGSHAFFQRFFDDPAFTAQYKAHWNTNYAAIAGITAFIDEEAAKIKKSQALNFKIWWENDPVDHANEIKKMKAWWTERVDYLNTELNK